MRSSATQPPTPPTTKSVIGLWRIRLNSNQPDRRWTASCARTGVRHYFAFIQINAPCHTHEEHGKFSIEVEGWLIVNEDRATINHEP